MSIATPEFETDETVEEALSRLEQARRIASNRASSFQGKLRRAVDQRRALDKAIGRFLDATDAIRTAPGQEARFLAREVQHDAFKALRTAFETTPKETTT